MDAIEVVKSHLQRARERRRYGAAVFLDIRGAFDHAWWPAIKVEIARKGCPDNIWGLMTDYLKDRRATVEIAGVRKYCNVERGCPQGSRSGPGLWNILYGTIFDVPLPEGTDVLGFADDTVLLAEAAQHKTLKTRVNEALRMLVDWATRTKLEFNPAKSDALYVGIKYGQARPSFKLGNHHVRCREACREAVKYLGVIIDERVNWKAHVEATVAKSRRISRMVVAMGRPTWGLGRGAVKAIYEGALLPAITYGAEHWEKHIRTKQICRLRTAQRGAALAAAGTYRTVSTEAALVIAGMIPLDLVTGESALVWEIERGGAELPDWPELEGASGVDSRSAVETDHPADRGLMTETETEGDVPHRGWNRIYTDGSKSEDGTGAAYVVYNGEEEVAAGLFGLWKECTVYQSELVAIREALRFVEDHAYAYGECDILSDSRSALEALSALSRPTRLIREIEELRRLVSAHTAVRWFWVRAHDGNPGNERADELAKRARTEGEKNFFTLAPIRVIGDAARARTLQKWQERWDSSGVGAWTRNFIPRVGGSTRECSYECRQLITGHGNFNAYLHRIGRREDGGCACGGPVGDAEHLLLDCRIVRAERGRADRELTIGGLGWPTGMGQVPGLHGEEQWWKKLEQFATGVRRLGKGTPQDELPRN